MDPSSLHSQIYSQQAMAISSTLTSGQSYYTLESLEGASSLPFLKPAPSGSLARRESLPPSLPLPLERLDAQARALLADREILDARARLLAAEREALLRNVPGGAATLQDQRMYTDGLQSVDARARLSLDGLQAVDARARLSLDGLQNVDTRPRTLLDNRALSYGLDARPGIPSLPEHRSLSHGIEMHPHDPLQPGVMNIPRVPLVVGGIPQGVTEHGSLSELLRARELGVGGPFVPAADPILVRRDIPNWRAEVPNFGAQNVHVHANGSREIPAMRFGLPEANKVKFQAERNKGVVISQPLFAKPPAVKKIKLPPEQSEGWCAVCKKDCNNLKTLDIHVKGRKHQAVVLGNAAKVATAAMNAPSTSEADKKRASDDKPEALQNAKRLKASSGSTPMVVATEVKIAKVDSQNAKPTAAVISNPSEQFCKLCNITTTGKANLDSHLKGKRHAARVRELANPQVLSAT